MRSTSGLVALCVLVSFVASLFFYGTGNNLVMLVVCWSFLLGAASFVGTRSADGAATALALTALALLVFNYQFTVSKDTSFAAAWVLAGLPASFVATSRLTDVARDGLWRGLLAVGAVLATISLGRFLWLGERAHRPLIDPNNYATLLYLLWIPFVHASLIRGWRQEVDKRSAAEVVATFVALAAIFATRSRTAALVVAAALAVWILVAVLRRLSLKGPLLHTLAALAALSMVLFVSADVGVEGAAASLGAGASVRLDLLESSWRMFLDRPLTGVGVFCFGLMYQAYRAPTEQLTAGLFVHNDYAQLLAEGGVALLAVPLGLLTFAAIKAVRGLRSRVDGEPFQHLGFALALGAACTHALVNFVFFSLPLVLLLGTLAGLALQPGVTGALPTGSKTRGAMRAAVVFGWVCFGYLALDMVTASVLQGQPGVPFAERLRSDPQSQMRYSRLAQTLNGDRGVPVLGEAAALAQLADSVGAPPLIRESALTRFRQAIRIDPWNTLSYVVMSDFVSRHRNALLLEPNEEPQMLLMTALALNPIYVPAIDRLLDLQRAEGRFGDSFALLRNVVYPWIELLKRRDDTAADRYFATLLALAEAGGDRAFVEELARKRDALADVSPEDRVGWFF